MGAAGATTACPAARLGDVPGSTGTSGTVWDPPAWLSAARLRSHLTDLLAEPTDRAQEIHYL